MGIRRGEAPFTRLTVPASGLAFKDFPQAGCVPGARARRASREGPEERPDPPQLQGVFCSSIHQKARKTRYTPTGSIFEFFNKVGASPVNYHDDGASPHLTREGTTISPRVWQR
jgi:hypothetical protein